MKEAENYIESIITRKISSEITAEEELILTSWLEKSGENEKLYQQLKKVYELAEVNSTVSNIDLDSEWHKFQNSVQPKRKEATYKTSWIRIAASIVLIATLGYVLWTGAFQDKHITILAEQSGQLVTLPDNTLVTLNKGAEITYPKIFAADNRVMKLKGEAFFEVTKNDKKPFIVNLKLGVVEVLGTSFNINAVANNDKLEVVVATGKVRLNNSNNVKSVIIIKGEKGTIMKNNNLVSKAENGDVNFMAWKTRKIVFNDHELDEVIHTLNQLYEENISFSTEVGKNCKVTVSFDNQSIEAILSVLEVTLNLEYKKSGNLIEIVKTGC